MTSMRLRCVASTSERRHVPAGILAPLGPPPPQYSKPWRPPPQYSKSSYAYTDSHIMAYYPHINQKSIQQNPFDITSFW